MVLDPSGGELMRTKGLYGARSVSAVGDGGTAVMKICNLSSRPLTIPAGLPLAREEQYDEERVKAMDTPQHGLDPARQQPSSVQEAVSTIWPAPKPPTLSCQLRVLSHLMSDCGCSCH